MVAKLTLNFSYNKIKFSKLIDIKNIFIRNLITQRTAFIFPYIYTSLCIRDYWQTVIDGPILTHHPFL